MGKKMYFGVGSKARKVKRMYFGVGGKARKVKKAYVGVGGVARLCFTSGELAYYGTVTPMGVTKHRFGSTSVGNYALFGGGSTGTASNQVTGNVEVYDATLTRKMISRIQTAQYITATSIGSNALFIGGVDSGGDISGELYSVNSSLTCSAIRYGGAAYRRQRAAAASIPNKIALFAGGTGGSNNRVLDTVEAYNISLTSSTPANLSNTKYDLAATSVGDYILFGGGANSTMSSGIHSSVDSYTSSLVKGSATGLSVARWDLTATSVGSYALFAGGYAVSNFYSVVDAYNTSLTRSTSVPLSVARRSLSATSIGGFALFGGGGNAQYSQTSAVDVYDESLVRTNPAGLSLAREGLGAAIVGNYALFAGGYNYANRKISNIVDAYVVK